MCELTCAGTKRDLTLPQVLATPASGSERGHGALQDEGLTLTRIAIAGFQHETNTFGATRAQFADFVEPDAWPGLLHGGEVIDGTAGINLPIAGFAEQAADLPDVNLVPIVWCSAEPCAHVTDNAFERISALILDGIHQAGPLDGVYLDLHGAMVTESFNDGEGELLRRIRARVGDDLPIVISLDLHANLTLQMVEHASSITIFRTYPHLDMARTGARACDALMHLIGGGRLFKAFRQSQYLVPLQAQYTNAVPCQGLYDVVTAQGRAPESWTELAMGFPAADIPDAGPAVVAYAGTQAEANATADHLMGALEEAETSFDTTLLSASEAVAQAMANAADKPVVIADVQDNAGAGATSDTTGLLRAMVENGAQRAVLALLHDPEAASAAHAAGLGAVIAVPLGGRSGAPDASPYEGRFAVEALSDGQFPFTGEMYAGSSAELGPTAVLRVLDSRAEVRVIVSSKRCQCLDLAILTHIGVEPSAQSIIGVKSSVHFRADFEPIAAKVINADAPGLNPCRLERVDYRHLREGLRLVPGGEPFRRPGG